MKVETLRWSDGVLEMIDQRILPATFMYLKYDSAAAVAEGIRSMVVRGAPAIGVAAAYGVALEAHRLLAVTDESFQRGMNEGFNTLAQSRPTAVNLFWALARMKQVWQSVASESNMQVAMRLLAEAHEIFAEDIRINRALGVARCRIVAGWRTRIDPLQRRSAGYSWSWHCVGCHSVCRGSR